jgi:hypothetical protein
MIEALDTPNIPAIPNPDGREWHPLTVEVWIRAWQSPMASQWLATDADALGRLAMVWDAFYKKPSADALKEIRLQSALFGLSPLDRSRLQWEVNRGDEADRKLRQRVEPAKCVSGDPRALLKAVK